jgi:hypothetical protein
MPRPNVLKTVAYKPKSRGNCGYCDEPVYKNAVRYKGRVFHSVCVVQAAKEGKI